MDAIKLADADKRQIRKLIPAGVELFLTQMLDVGAFHADPYPGNLYFTKNDTLCLLDFGVCTTIDAQSRKAMSTAIVHLLAGDFDSPIARNAKDLGFLPQDMDLTELYWVEIQILTYLGWVIHMQVGMLLGFTWHMETDHIQKVCHLQTNHCENIRLEHDGKDHLLYDSWRL